MNIFNLPDLGEGLPEAEIREWYVKAGDEIKADQPMVAMETAKAIVDVPAPQTGKIAKLYGTVGDVIPTGAPLMAFEEIKNTSETTELKTIPTSAATVAGSIEVGDRVIEESATGIEVARLSHGIKILPAIRMLAIELGLNLQTISGTGEAGSITVTDIASAYKRSLGEAPPAKNISSSQYTLTADSNTFNTQGTVTPLRGVRRGMYQTMSQSHAEIVPVTLSDDAIIGSWPTGTDITLRLIRAIIAACKIQPEINAWFDSHKLERMEHKAINLGIAMDSGEGLFVPVLKDIAAQTPEFLRTEINRFKEQVTARTVPQNDLRGATLIFSNFGTFAGRYASPIIVPPCVAIIGTGRLREMPVAVDGKVQVQRVMPISLTVDHRVITGGEAARFLKALIDDLQA